VALAQPDLSELLDALRAGGDVDLIRSSVELVLQALIEEEATEFIGAGRHERTESRTNQRNGTRPTLVTTKAGDVELTIPKLRHGSFAESHVRATPHQPHVPPSGVLVPNPTSLRGVVPATTAV
jgi:putative transposase